MSDDERSHSEYFEELCALAASGQVSEEELVELQDHMQECAACRSAYSDFSDLVRNKLILADSEVTHLSAGSGVFLHNTALKQRFLTRARKQGLVLSPNPESESFWSRFAKWLWPQLTYQRVSAAVIGILLLTIGALGYSMLQSNTRYRQLAFEMAAPSEAGSRPRATAVAPEPSRESTSAAAPTSAVLPPVANTAEELELAQARRDYAASEERARDLQDQLQAAAAELGSVRGQLEEATVSRTLLATRLAETEQNFNRVSDELQDLRAGRFKDSATILAQDSRIQELSRQLSAQTEILDRERTLLAAGRDIHDLMGARNLHIVDVYDVDTKGKDSQAFGRVFYTEAKSLIFYAFDLGDRNTEKRNASFQVWGTSGPTQSTAQSLGIFYVDDQKQNRWVLQFENPAVLSEIDSVFVTVEPPGGSSKPTGHKLLYAYLKANPNHP